MQQQKYEYDFILARRGNVTKLLNSVAEEGWVLVAVTPGYTEGTDGLYLARELPIVPETTTAKKMYNSGPYLTPESQLSLSPELYEVLKRAIRSSNAHLIILRALLTVRKDGEAGKDYDPLKCLLDACASYE